MFGQIKKSSNSILEAVKQSDENQEALTERLANTHKDHIQGLTSSLTNVMKFIDRIRKEFKSDLSSSWKHANERLQNIQDILELLQTDSRQHFDVSQSTSEDLKKLAETVNELTLNPGAASFPTLKTELNPRPSTPITSQGFYADGTMSSPVQFSRYGRSEYNSPLSNIITESGSGSSSSAADPSGYDLSLRSNKSQLSSMAAYVFWNINYVRSASYKVC